MPDRPSALIEILVAEYEQQAKMNQWPSLPYPFNDSRTIISRCDLIEEEARKIIGDEDQQPDRANGTACRLTPDQQEFFFREANKLLEDFYRHLHDLEKPDPENPERKIVKRAALCISGGGIRSATFALGLLQGLAQRQMVSKFHFLSTVSGGGYIGSWLSAWIHRQGIRRVEHDLALSGKSADGNKSESPITATDPEPETIQHLRRYSNYMSPRLGLFSADTWTLVGTFLRNLLLNWTVLIPLLAAAMAIPRLAVSIASWNCPRPLAEKLAIVIAFLAGVVCVTYMVASLPGWRKKSRLPESWKTEKRFLVWCWLTLNASAFLSAFYWSWIHIPKDRCVNLFGSSIHPAVPFILFGLSFHLLGYLIARLFLVKLDSRGIVPELFDFAVRGLTGVLGGACLWAVTLAFQPAPITIDACYKKGLEYSKCAPVAATVQNAAKPSPQASPAASVSLPISSLPAQIEISVLPKAAAVDAETKAKQELEASQRRIGINAGLYTSLGPPLFLLMFLIAATIFIGVASTYTNDADRELMARTGAWMLISIFGWSVFCALVIFGPVGLIWLWKEFKISLLSVSTISGLLTLIGGFSSKTSASKKNGSDKGQTNMAAQLLTNSLPAAATIFVLLTLAALSLATSALIAVAYFYLKNHGAVYQFTCWLLAKLQAVPFINSLLPLDFKERIDGMAWLPSFSTDNAWWHLDVLYNSPAILVVFVVGTILAGGLAMGLFVNINKFSLHSAYRDRLIRAYLGASNNTRRPNPFTGFDERDNIQFHNLLTELFRPQNFGKDLRGLVEILRNPQTKSAAFIYDHLTPETKKLLEVDFSTRTEMKEALKQALADDFNRIIQSEDLYKEDAFGKPMNNIEGIAQAPDIPLFHLFGRPMFNRAVYVQKLLMNRRLIEKTFGQWIESPEQLGFDKEARPLHIVNIALNLVGGKELAWQERKAQPFTVSPLHAGSFGVGYRNSTQYAISRQQNGALTLGTSMAISGAAVSPNMGYNSSSAVTFLLMLFNVRLGWWLGNPGSAGQETYMKPSPFFTPKPLIAETLGMTDSQHSYVYLSDGAHFENLALYEMVRRRCHFIILSDAGADSEFNFDDLGNAMRKIRIDLGVPIEFAQGMTIRHRVEADKLFAADGKAPGKYCALARIRYSAIDGKNLSPDQKEEMDGWLIYIKPTVYGLEPQDVLNYAKSNETFPHETTGDQMYSESQFESYRALGAHVIKQIFGRKQMNDFEDLVKRAEEYLNTKEKDSSQAPNEWSQKIKKILDDLL